MVRNGGTVGKDQFGSGRTRKIPASKIAKAKRGGGGGGKKNDCCPMVAAVRSAKRGNFRLARRYAALSVRLVVRRAVAWA